MEQSVIDAIQSCVETVNGKQKLACSHAHTIADQHHVPLKMIGDYCTAHFIKISACQLGCFK